MDTTIHEQRSRVTRGATKAYTYVIGLFCGVTFLAAVTAGHAYVGDGRSSSERSNYVLCETCEPEEEFCISSGEERMNDCLDAAEEKAAEKCASLSDEPTPVSSDVAFPGDSAFGADPTYVPGPSERQQCEQAMLNGGTTTTANPSVALTYPSGVEFGADTSSNRYDGLYGRCNSKHGPNEHREADCKEERIRCQRTCVDAD
jgi:hypothetical protein